MSNNVSETTIRAEFSTAQQSLGNIIEDRSGAARPRRTSSLRLFTNRFPRLHRTSMEEASASSSDTPEAILPAGTSSLASPDEASNPFGLNEPTDEAVEAYMRRNAHNCTQLRAIMERIAKRLPSTIEDEHGLSEDSAMTAEALPTNLRVAIRMFPQTKILTEAQQEINVAIEVEGVLHNRIALPNATVDVIFIVDNGYYVTKNCLEQATDAIKGALYHMGRGDRLALYTTHCAHNIVTGNKPELHYPLRHFSTDTEYFFQDLTANILKCGTQVWEPPRPNPSMTDVVLAVTRSLKDQDLKQGRTHIILLSPAAYVLHDVSKSFPDPCIHRINPAALPYCREPELQNTVCFDDCCKNVFVSNWTSYQSVSSRVRRILQNARFKNPVGELTKVSIDVRTREGCELVACSGSKEVSHLRPGQVHALFVRIRVNRSKTEGVNLVSANPVFNSSLDIKGLRQELQNAVAVGAIRAHIFDVQLCHQNSINTVDCWNYMEAPLTLIKVLGGLAPPAGMALEIARRQYFHKFSQMTTSKARLEIDNFLAVLDVENDLARNVLERFSKEIKCHEAIQKYERECCHKLALCPGPFDMEASHEWLLELWNKNKNKRNGITWVRVGTPGLVDGFNNLVHHF